MFRIDAYVSRIAIPYSRLKADTGLDAVETPQTQAGRLKAARSAVNFSL